MTAAQMLLADLRSRGIELETDGTRLRWRPAFLVTEPQQQLLLANKDQVIALLRNRVAASRCPICRWPLESSNRCPKCFDRLCKDCGNLTGSYFIQRCAVCGCALDAQGGLS